ncbi:MAG: hypothetical protein HZA15_11090 [Nitrospirae bacterium]|nr:hypothetical protein [Nitrospirota bacterium]
MSNNDSAKDLIDLIKRRAPEYLDLLTAQTDADFEAAFDARLDRALIDLENNKMNFNKLDEEGLSAVLASALSCPGLSVTQETNSNGHVDITIEADHCFPARRKLGEAKIYDGPEYHVKGLKQLLGRYTTGREGRGVLIIYVRKKDIAGIVNKLRQRMDEVLPMNQKGKTKEHVLKWSFISTHKHSSGEDLDVGHIGCNLYIS